MRLYIIRHGETDWNVKGRLQGQTDTPLNEKGIRLAEITAEGMKEISFDLAITSPLERARQTAEIVLGERRTPVLEDWRIAEIRFGPWEGLGCRKENFQIPDPGFEDFYQNPFHYQPPEGGESVKEVCERAREFFHEVIGNPLWKDKTILIATHGCACRAILNNVYENKLDFWHGRVPPNCAVNIVDVKDGKAMLTEEDKIYYSADECIDFRTGKKLKN